MRVFDDVTYYIEKKIKGEKLEKEVVKRSKNRKEIVKDQKLEKNRVTTNLLGSLIFALKRRFSLTLRFLNIISSCGTNLTGKKYSSVQRRSFGFFFLSFPPLPSSAPPLPLSLSLISYLTQRCLYIG